MHRESSPPAAQALGGARAIVALAVAAAAISGCRLRASEQGESVSTQPPAAVVAHTERSSATDEAGTGQPDRPAAVHSSPAVEVGYPALPVEELVSRLRSSVVSIRTTVAVKRGPGTIYPGPLAQDGAAQDPMAQDVRSLGSGFIIDRSGRILTNDHIVAQARELLVMLPDGVELPARVVGRAPELDVALLAVDTKRPLEPIPLGESSGLRVGEWVVAMGNPFGREVVASIGIIAGVDGATGTPFPDSPGALYRSFLLTDAAIHAANSGGPLVDMAGSVVGINVAAEPNGSRLGFAVPIDRVAPVLGMLERDGRIQRTWLGAYIQPVTPEEAARRGLEPADGALVSEVRDNAPAARAGLRPGDIVLRFDGQRVDHRNLPWLVATAGPGRRIPVVIWRDGAERDVEIIGELRPE